MIDFIRDDYLNDYRQIEKENCLWETVKGKLSWENCRGKTAWGSFFRGKYHNIIGDKFP